MTPLTSDYALEVIDLKKAFGGLAVTQDVSLAIRPGERRLIIGPNGAGKTTLFNQISGDMRPNAGEIRLFGTDVTLSPYRRAHLGLSRTYQIITLFSAATRSNTMSRSACSVCGLRAGRCGGRCPITAISRPKPAGRSTRSGFCIWPIIRCPTLPMAKNAASSWRWRWRRSRACCCWTNRWRVFRTPSDRQVKSLIASIPRETTVIMIEHDMDTALDLAETVTLLNYGRVIVDGERDAVIADERTREVYLGA